MAVPITAHRHELNELFREIADRLQRRDPPFRIRLPNLRISTCDLNRVGDAVRINVDVINDGLGVSGECDLQAVVEVIPPGGLQAPVTQRVKKLPPGGIHRFRPFHEVPIAGDGLFVNVQLTVDPPTAARPGGEVWESDERDNSEFCGIFTTMQEPDEPPDLDKPGLPSARRSPKKATAAAGGKRKRT